MVMPTHPTLPGIQELKIQGIGIKKSCLVMLVPVKVGLEEGTFLFSCLFEKRP